MFSHQEEEYLPWTNQQYSINDQGVVKEGEIPIKQIIVNDIRMVELDWYDGQKLYRYDIIPVICYFKIKLPKQLLDHIELIYKDSNKDNLCIDNLAYRFINGPVESERFPGYYYVPYYTDYVIDRIGDVISLKNYRRRNTVEHKKWTVSKPIPTKKNIKGGYYCGRGKRDHDNVDGVSRHRFLALAFIPYSTDPMSLVVNHKNGIPGNDWLDNLEWVTYSENTKHAYQNNLHFNKVVRIVFLDENRGIEKRYSSVADCVRENGFSPGFYNSRLKKPHVRYRDGIRVKLDDGKEWPEILQVGAPSFPRAVMAKNMFTGDIIIFETMVKAGQITNVDNCTIKYHCDHEAPTPTKGFSFRYVSTDVDWPKCSEYHLRMYRRFPEGLIPHGLFLLDDQKQIVAFYECLKDFQKESNLTENQICFKLRKNKSWNGLHLRRFNVRGAL